MGGSESGLEWGIVVLCILILQRCSSDNLEFCGTFG